MHGFSSGSGLLVNAEVDSMGGVVDGGGIFGTKSSPRHAAIKKAQAELKQEYDVREKRRRELEFLEKGGNPLDFKSVNTVSVSVQSTSLTNLQPEQLNSEVKGSFALTASPHGDSVESSGRPGQIPSVFEPNSGDNLMLFDGENDCVLPNKRNNNNNAVLSEQSEQLDGAQNVKESVDSATFALPKKAYRRRNRSRPNRDGAARSSSTVFPKSNGGILLKSVPADSPLDMELDSVRVVESKGDPPDADSRILHDKQQGSEKASADVAIKEKHENQLLRGQMNGVVTGKGARKNISNESKIKEPSDTVLCTNLENIDSNGNVVKEKNLVPEQTENFEGKLVKEKTEILADDISGPTRTDQEKVSLHKTEDLLDKSSKSRAVDEAVGKEKSVAASETDLKESNLLDSKSTPQVEKPADSSVADLLESSTSVKESAVVLEQQPLLRINLKLKSKTHEDSILEEARIIEAKRKRIAELSAGTLPSENHRKSQWDFVLEEMAWMANDFAQERLWKVSAAGQISRRVAAASKLRFEEWNSCWKQKEVAQTVVKAVMDFWHKVEDKSKELDQQSPSKDFDLPIEGYAASFLKYNSFSAQHCSSQAPMPRDNISHIDIPDISWEEDHLTEENLFYTVAPGTMEAYRSSIENHLLQLGKTGSNIQDEVELSGYDAVAENTYEEDEGETSTYYLPGAFNGSKSSKFAQKKKKNFIKTNSARFYEAGADLSFMDNNNKFGKRPATSLNVSFPTKRVRTASRQRVISPFNIGPSGIIHPPNKTEASSGDTNSFQDDQSTMHSGFQIPNSLEVESTRNFEKQHPFDSTEVSNKPKKKKKTKHLVGSAYEHRWQPDSNFSNEQRDQLRKRTDNHQLESNGSTGLFGQNPSKKPKTMRQSLDNSMDIHNPMIGSSVPSPVGSSMSNIPNRNKFIKMISGRDRGRKNKALKMPSGQQGPGSPWSLYEEQALVVLVHDMGPNWELVSDAMNSTLQFKCIYRKPKECCERHKELMDKNADGADSAEDSGTSQPYPSTLPGIPKGSARQLFQHLQGPMEEETLKSHFEKIIVIEQKQHSRKTRNDIHDPKQLQQPHSSHTLALSQVCPNNLSGGPVLTPLDLCDSTACSPESSMGYQGPGLPISSQATASSALPPPATNSSALPPSPNPAAPLNAPSRDGRYGIPRTGSLPIDDQQRMQQYSQILSGRNIPQSGLPVPSGGSNERGVRLLPPGGNGMGMIGGLNRSMSMSRPGGFQSGIPSSSMLNSGSMLSSGGMSPVNIHPAPGSNQGNSLLRPRDNMHMIRPHPEMQNNSPGAPSPSPFSGGISPPFSNQTAQTLPPVQSYPLHHHQSHPMSPQQSLSHHPHLPNHAANTQNQAYAMRMAKDRQLQHQQRFLQHQQFTAPNPLMQQPPQPQNNNGSNNSNTQASPPPVPLQPMTSSSPKHHMPLNRNMPGGGSGSGSGNPTGKPRQRHPQQFQGGGTGRNHPQQRQQQPQSQQQQGKVLKSGGGIRPNNINNNITPADTSTLNNGPSSTKEGSHSSNQKVQTAPSLKQSQSSVSQSDNPLQPPPQPHPKLLNRSQPTSQRLIQPNRQPLNSSQLVPSRIPLQVPKPESRGPTSQQSTDAQPPPPPPPPPPPQYDSSDTLSALRSGSTDTSPPETAATPENPEPVGQGVIQRPPPGNSVTVGPEKPSVQQQPQQLAAPVAEESDQKLQILQAGNKNSLYVRPPNSGVE